MLRQLLFGYGYRNIHFNIRISGKVIWAFLGCFLHVSSKYQITLTALL